MLCFHYHNDIMLLLVSRRQCHKMRLDHFYTYFSLCIIIRDVRNWPALHTLKWETLKSPNSYILFLNEIYKYLKIDLIWLKKSCSSGRVGELCGRFLRAFYCVYERWSQKFYKRILLQWTPLVPQVERTVTLLLPVIK